MCKSTRILVNATAEESFMGNSIEATYELLEEMASNIYQWLARRNMPKKTIGVHEIDILTTLSS